MTFLVILMLGLLRTSASTQVQLLDPTFQPVLPANGEVFAAVVQGDGRIVVGGIFDSVSGQPTTNLARLFSNGRLDSSFGIGTDKEVLDLAQQTDGKIVAGGSFTKLEGVTRFGIGRFLTNGQVDPDFSTGTFFQTNGTVFRLAVQPDGKILVGTVLVFDGALFRLNTNGTLDNTFVQTNIFENYWIHSFLVRTNGDILIGGGFQSVNGFTSPGLVLLDSSGNLNTNFQSNLKPNSDAFSIIEQTNGGFLVSGVIKPPDGSPDIAMARLTPALTWDTNFHASQFDLTSRSGDCVRSAFQQADGKIVVGGQFNTVGGYWRQHIARLDANGQVDPCFDPGPGLGGTFGVVYVTSQPDGRVLAGGFFGISGLIPANLVRLLPQSDCDATRVYFWKDAIFSYAAGSTPPGGTNFLQSSTNMTDWVNLDVETQPFVFSVVDVSKPRTFFRVKKVQ